MNKILLIIKREYLTRIKKRSFIVMTIIGPILISSIFFIQIWLKKSGQPEKRHIAVIDENYQDGLDIIRKNRSDTATDLIMSFYTKIPSSEYLKFTYLEEDTFSEKEKILRSGYDAVLYLPERVLKASTVEIYSYDEITLGTKNYIENHLEKIIEKEKLRREEVDANILARIRTDINIISNIIKEDGTQVKSNLEINIIISIIGSFLIYMFIFMYGAQVMRGIIEEKTGRIVEVIISSVKPFQLMMGKIVGVAMVGLTQFFLWVILTVIFVGTIQLFILDPVAPPTEQLTPENFLSKSQTQSPLMPAQAEEEALSLSDTFESLKNIPFGLIISSFIFFFLGGYLLYSSLFAAVGSAIDYDTDAQQFMLPITIPLVVAIIVAMNVFDNPDSTFSYWFSIIPFTSPIVMMARLPFSPPATDIIISMILLILTFIGTTWLAGKIYRTGILMYGKKVNYRELWKWLRYKG